MVRSALKRGRFTLVASEPLFAEFRGVLARPRFFRRYGVTAEQIDAFVRPLVELAEIAEVRGEIQLCRDPKDNMVIETAINGRADVIVSRDEDLARDLDLVAALTEYGIRVLTVERFLRELDEEA
jgi:uncharacterized protein